MAFGDYATLLSDFTGTDENPLSEGGVWTNKIITVDSNMKRVGGTAGAAGTTGSAWWNSSTFGPGVEAYFTIAQKPPTNGDWVRLFARLNTPGTSGVDGYLLQIATQSGTDTFALHRITNAGTTLVGSGSQEFATGDRFGIEFIGDQLNVYYSVGTGSWSQILNVTDGTYQTVVGNVGIGSKSSINTRLDDFFAGTIDTGAKSGYAISGLTGAGASVSFFTESGLAVVGTVGSGAKEFTGSTEYVKAGNATVGLVGSGVKDHQSTGATYTKVGHAIVGTTVTSTSGHAVDVVYEGIVIAFGSSTLDPYPTWTRIDQ